MRTILALGLIISLGIAQDFDFPVSVTRPAPKSFASGDSVEVSCNLGQGLQIADNVCSWTYDGSSSFVYDFDSGEVSGDNSDSLSFSGDAQSCSVSIASFQSDLHGGEWTCQLNTSEDQFHKGAFQLISSDMEEPFPIDIDLPRHLTPSTYRVELLALLDDGILDGSVEIDLTYESTPEYSNRLALNIYDLLIEEDSVEVRNSLEETLTIAGHEYDIDREWYVLHFAEELNPETFLNVYTVEMDFQSKVGNSFFTIPYIDIETGEETSIALTDMITNSGRAVGTRSVFPCLDEPDFKARFTLKLGYDETKTALSNMDITETEAIEGMAGYVMDTFRTSDAMSTYLFAISMSDFVTTATSEDRTNIWSRIGTEESVALAAEAAPVILSFFEEYLDINYTLPKLDHVILPDFGTVGMENWGMITYAESIAVFDESYSSAMARDDAVFILSHEMAHMWFGDLVTTADWGQMWLNEGFATYMEHKGKNAFDAELRSDERFLLTGVHDSMAVDSVPMTTKAVSRTINNPRYQNVLLPHLITYQKGGSILRMAEFVLGEDTMRKGLHNYLAEHEHGNVNEEDVWNALKAAAVEDGVLAENFDLTGAMEAWINEPGFPTITASNNGDGTVTVTQSRFYLYPSDDQGDDDTIWQIPISISYPGSEDYELVWMTDSSMDVPISQTPYLINYQQRGYYHVNYDSDNWLELANVLKQDPESIDPLNRAQIYDDSLNLARAGLLSYDVVLDIAQSLIFEEEYLPLEAGLKALNYLGKMFSGNQRMYADFQDFVTTILTPSYNSLTFDEGANDDYFTVLRRSTVIANMCRYGYQDCLDQASALFQDWKDNRLNPENNPINPNLRETVYQVAARTASSSDYDFFLDRLATAGQFGITEESQRILKALGNIGDQDILQDLLDLTITEDSVIRKLDASIVYAAMSSSEAGRNFQLSWLVDRYDEVKAYFGDAFGGSVNAMLSSFGQDSSFPSDISELESFIESYGVDFDAETNYELETALFKARRNEEWVEANFASILNKLESGILGRSAKKNEVLRDDVFLDLPLSVVRPDRAVVGSQADVACVLGGGDENVILSNTCSWLTPQGDKLIADLSTGQVTNDDTSEVVDGVTAYGDDADKTCGLIIEAIREEDLGDWSCLINEDQSSVPFHEGTFSLLDESHTTTGIRLPRHIMPSSYEISLSPDLAALTTQGSLTLHATFDDTAEEDAYSDKIVVHARNIHIVEDSVAVLDGLLTPLGISGHGYDFDRDLYTIFLSEAMNGESFLNSLTINIDFVSVIHEQVAEGLYTSQTLQDDVAATFLASDFSKTGARSAFPCLDEPDFRAAFYADLTLALDDFESDATALFNSELLEQTTDDANLYLTFGRSDSLPTSSLAIFAGSSLGSFSTLSISDESNSTVSVWSVNQEDQASEAADLATDTLEFLSSYTGVSYSQDQLNLVAVPEVMPSSGTGGGWGMLSFKESRVLYDAEESSVQDLLDLQDAVSKDVSKMWFGDFISIDWWDNQWILEGLPRYLGLRSLESTRSDLAGINAAISSDLHANLRVDDRVESLDSTAENPKYDAVERRFLAAKGGWLMRMAEGFAGETAFRQALSSFLVEGGGFSSTMDPSLLWELLDRNAKAEGNLEFFRNVKNIMETWTSNSGYPVVSIRPTGDTIMTLTQEPFGYEFSGGDDLWDIPITVWGVGSDTEDEDKASIHWLTDASTEISLVDRPYLANHKQSGYFRVNYDSENWEAIIDLMASDPQAIESTARAQLYDDAFNLARAGKLDYLIPLQLSNALSSETEFLPLRAAMDNFEYLDLMVRASPTNAYQDLKSHILEVLQPLYDTLGFDPLSRDEEEDYNTVLVRGLVSSWMCYYEYEDCVITSIEAFHEWMDGAQDAANPVNPDLRNVVYQTEIRQDGGAAFEFLMEKLESTTLEEERAKMLRAMAATTNTDRLLTLLDMIVADGSSIRTQEAPLILDAASRSSEGRAAALAWIRDNSDALSSKYSEKMFGELILSVTSSFATGASLPSDVSELALFADESVVGKEVWEAIGGQITLDLDAARRNERWVEGNFARVFGFFDGLFEAGATTTATPTSGTGSPGSTSGSEVSGSTAAVTGSTGEGSTGGGAGTTVTEGTTDESDGGGGDATPSSAAANVAILELIGGLIALVAYKYF